MTEEEKRALEEKEAQEKKESEDAEHRDENDDGEQIKKTIDEVMGGDNSDDEDDSKDDSKGESVPLKTFLEIKKEKKDMEKELIELRKLKEDGASKSEVDSDLEAIAEKYDVDPKFLDELSKIIYSKAKGDVEATLKPLQAKEKAEKITKVFNEHFDKVIEEMPEYSDIVNRDVIKELTLLPQNAKKTFQQIIEETYGKTVTGKKTLETGTPRGGKDVGIDESKLNDPSYFSKIMANPELKKKYNEGIAKRILL